jgi:magnesium chelatase family protein
MKIARTISDLEGSEEVKKEHIIEAIHYRVLDKTISFDGGGFYE